MTGFVQADADRAEIAALRSHLAALERENERLRADLMWIATCTVAISQHTMLLQERARTSLEATDDREPTIPTDADVETYIEAGEGWYGD